MRPARATRLTILDASGRRVAEVRPRVVADGVVFVWKRSEAAGGGAPAAVYFVRLNVPGAPLMRKLVAR